MDSKKIAEILIGGLEKTKKSIQKNLSTSGRNASGSTSKSLKVTSSITPTQVRASLLGSSVLEQLEYGRGKTKNPSSNATWAADLRGWMRIRGIPEGAFYPIWRKINEEGYKGTAGIVSNPVDDFKKGVAEDIKAIILKDFKSNGVNSNQ